MTCSAVYATKGMKQIVHGYYYLKGHTCVYVPISIACQVGGDDCKYLDPALGVNLDVYWDIGCITRMGRDL